MKRALRLCVSLMCGLVFGFGLALSGMLDPTRIRGFLDVFGQWDPSLAFVLVGAVGISFIGVRFSRHLSAPILDERYDLPTRTSVSVRLVLGAAIFGVGWGLSGLCPGPAVASLALGFGPTVAFAMAMVVGMLLHAAVTSGHAGPGPDRLAPDA